MPVGSLIRMIGLFQFYFYFCLLVYVHTYVPGVCRPCLVAYEGQKRATAPLELALERVVIFLCGELNPGPLQKQLLTTKPFLQCLMSLEVFLSKYIHHCRVNIKTIVT